MNKDKTRLTFAWTLLATSVLGWPISALTFAKGEPVTVLGLSWLAIALTAVDILFTVNVRNQQDE